MTEWISIDATAKELSYRRRRRLVRFRRALIQVLYWYDYCTVRLYAAKSRGGQWMETFRSWIESNPRAALALVPFVGMPRSLGLPENQGFWPTIGLLWPLLLAASYSWSSAYSQFQSLFLNMVESQVVATQGRAHFDARRSYLAPTPVAVMAIAATLIAISAAFQTMCHRATIIVTNLSWRARSVYSYKHHLIQIASAAMYCGTLMYLVGLCANHWGVLEVWVYRFITSELILVPATSLVVAGHYLKKRREQVATDVYGSPLRAFVAGTVSMCFSITLLGIALPLLSLVNS